MRAMLAGLRLDAIALAAIGVGAFAMLFLGVANADAPAAELRGVLWGFLGLVLTAMASMLDVVTMPHEESLEEEAHWYEYDGTFRGMVG